MSTDAEMEPASSPSSASPPSPPPSGSPALLPRLAARCGCRTRSRPRPPPLTRSSSDVSDSRKSDVPPALRLPRRMELAVGDPAPPSPSAPTVIFRLRFVAACAAATAARAAATAAAPRAASAAPDSVTSSTPVSKHASSRRSGSPAASHARYSQNAGKVMPPVAAAVYRRAGAVVTSGARRVVRSYRAPADTSDAPPAAGCSTGGRAVSTKGGSGMRVRAPRRRSGRGTTAPATYTLHSRSTHGSPATAATVAGTSSLPPAAGGVC